MAPKSLYQARAALARGDVGLAKRFFEKARPILEERCAYRDTDATLTDWKATAPELRSSLLAERIRCCRHGTIRTTGGHAAGRQCAPGYRASLFCQRAALFLQCRVPFSFEGSENNWSIERSKHKNKNTENKKTKYETISL